MKVFAILFALLATTGCTVTVNLAPQPYYQQALVQPLQQPAMYSEPVRAPKSIKAVQNRTLTQQEFRTSDASLLQYTEPCGPYSTPNYKCKDR